MTTSALAIIWFLIVCLEIGLYIILDGADLGIGLLTLLPQEAKTRSLLMHTVGPIWDANETWLVVAGGTLFGAFPSAYAIILNALYIPVFMIIFGLIFRAVAFDFGNMSAHKRFWHFAFGFGSFLAIMGQGFAAGGLLNGIVIVNGEFGGGPFDWLTPLSSFIAIGILMSYIVVGYAYLIKKTDHEFEEQSFPRVIIAAGFTFIAFVAATIILPFRHYVFLARWTTEPTRSALLTLSVAIAALSCILLYGALRRRLRRHLHTLCIVIFLLAFLGLVIGIYPYMIPPYLTIFDLAATEKTLTFMLWGIGPLLPIVLGYNFYLYRVFRNHTFEKGGEEY
jgi:cytochrome d ubiquinol oxidase subunit II